jgi:hypothetical protein
MLTDVTCPGCHRAVPIDTLLGAASGYRRATNSGASSCPSCGQSMEFRVGAGVIELGFTYWAGILHFESVSSHRLEALRVAWTDDTLIATVGTRSFVLAPFLTAKVT